MELRVKCLSIEQDFEEEKIGIVEFIHDGREFTIPMDMVVANTFNVGGSYTIQFTHYPTISAGA